MRLHKTYQNMKQHTLKRGVQCLFVSGLLFSPAVLFADTAGLWFGMVEVTHINQVHGELTEGEGDDKKIMTDCIAYPAGSGSPCDPVAMPQPIPHPFHLQMLLHVDSSGVIKLLREAYIMQTKPESGESVERVVVTDEAKLGDYDGIIRRDGKLVAVRLASTSFPIPFGVTSQPVVGGISDSGSLSVTLQQASTHPTNPFRHQYHPMHGEGVDITRTVTVNFKAAEASANVNPKLGLSEFRGEYLETLQGMHKSDLKVACNIILTQVNQVGVLDGVEQ